MRCIIIKNVKRLIDDDAGRSATEICIEAAAFIACAIKDREGPAGVIRCSPQVSGASVVVKNFELIVEAHGRDSPADLTCAPAQRRRVSVERLERPFTAL